MHPLMTLWSRFTKRHSRPLAFFAALILVGILPAAVTSAQTSSQVTYAQGVNGVGGDWRTTGYAPRQWNRVWRQPGPDWGLSYQYTNGQYCCFWIDNINPTVSHYGISYGRAWCSNLEDNTGVLWTCQTTY